MNFTDDVHRFPAMLRRLADDLETLSGVELAPTKLRVGLQVVCGDASEAARTHSALMLAECLGSHVEPYEVNATERHLGTPYDAARHGAEITVFTALHKPDRSSR